MIPEFPLKSGATIEVIVTEFTHCMAQYWPTGMLPSTTIVAPASPKLCLSILLVIGVCYVYALKKASLHYFGFFAVLAASLKFFAVGAALLPTLFIFSPLPDLMRSCLALILLYSPCFIVLCGLTDTIESEVERLHLGVAVVVRTILLMRNPLGMVGAGGTTNVADGSLSPAMLTPVTLTLVFASGS